MTPGKTLEVHDNLSLVTLDAEFHRRTCGYWYLIRRSAQAHTAFAKREHLLAWLAERGLELTEDLPPHGTHSFQRLQGKYATACHRTYDPVLKLADDTRWERRYDDPKERNPDELPIITRTCSNGSYTLAVITESAGMRVVNYLNPNCKYRPEYDYTESKALHG